MTRLIGVLPQEQIDEWAVRARWLQEPGNHRTAERRSHQQLTAPGCLIIEPNPALVQPLLHHVMGHHHTILHRSLR